MTNPPQEHDLSRLPKWAQTRIETLEANLAYAKAKLDGGPEDSDTFADPYGEPPRSLGSGPMIRFGGLGFEGTFDVRWRNGELLIQGNTGRDELVIKPQSSNTIRLAAAPPKES